MGNPFKYRRKDNCLQIFLKGAGSCIFGFFVGLAIYESNIEHELYQSIIFDIGPDITGVVFGVMSYLSLFAKRFFIIRWKEG